MWAVIFTLWAFRLGNMQQKLKVNGVTFDIVYWQNMNIQPISMFINVYNHYKLKFVWFS